MTHKRAQRYVAAAERMIVYLVFHFVLRTLNEQHSDDPITRITLSFFYRVQFVEVYRC